MKDKTFRALTPLPIVLTISLVTLAAKPEMSLIALILYVVGAAYSIIIAPHGIRGTTGLCMVTVIIMNMSVGCVIAIAKYADRYPNGKPIANATTDIWTMVLFGLLVAGQLLTLMALTAPEDKAKTDRN